MVIQAVAGKRNPITFSGGRMSENVAFISIYACYINIEHCLSDNMFFKRQDAVKPIPFAELGRFVSSLFDSHISKGIDSINRSITTIVDEAARFAALSEKFSASDTEPDIEFIEHMGIGFIKSQKDIYAKSLLSILQGAQSGERVVADTRYEEAKLRKEALESVMQEILKLNSKFSMILVAYPKQMDAFKRQFSRIEKLLKSINDQLKGMSGEVAAYNGIMGKIYEMADQIGAINEAAPGTATASVKEEGSEERLRAEIEALEKERSTYESKIHSLEDETNSIRHNLSSLLQPLLRAARIYDHESKSKIRISDLIRDIVGQMQGAVDYRAFEAELLKMQGYISSNPSKFKGHGTETMQITEAINGNVQGKLSRLNSLSNEVDAINGKIRELNGKIHERVSEKNKMEERLGEETDREEKLRNLRESLSGLKGEVERQCLNSYEAKIEITEIPHLGE